MNGVPDQTTEAGPTSLARENWNKDRVWLAENHPDWPMPTWSKAQAWRRKPYIVAARDGKHPDETGARDDAG